MARENLRCKKPLGKAAQQAFLRLREPRYVGEETLPDPFLYFLKTAHFLSALIMDVAAELRASETFYLSLTSLKLFMLKGRLCGYIVPWWQRSNFNTRLEETITRSL